MTQPRQFRSWPKLGLRGWAIVVLTFTAVAAILVAIAVLTVGIFLFLLPVLAIVALLYYLLPSRLRTARYSRGKKATIIDGEYRVVDTSDMEKPRTEERD